MYRGTLSLWSGPLHWSLMGFSPGTSSSISSVRIPPPHTCTYLSKILWSCPHVATGKCCFPLFSLCPFKKKDIECIPKHTGHVYPFGNSDCISETWTASLGLLRDLYLHFILHCALTDKCVQECVGKIKEEDLWFAGVSLTHDPQHGQKIIVLF